MTAPVPKAGVAVAATHSCPGCGNSLPAGEAICAICDRAQGGQYSGRRGPGALLSWVLVLAGLAVLFGLGWLAGH